VLCKSEPDRPPRFTQSFSPRSFMGVLMTAARGVVDRRQQETVWLFRKLRDALQDNEIHPTSDWRLSVSPYPLCFEPNDLSGRFPGRT
jgi:hypothetical protein